MLHQIIIQNLTPKKLSSCFFFFKKRKKIFFLLVILHNIWKLIFYIKDSRLILGNRKFQRLDLKKECFVY